MAVSEQDVESGNWPRRCQKQRVQGRLRARVDTERQEPVWDAGTGSSMCLEQSREGKVAESSARVRERCTADLGFCYKCNGKVSHSSA